MKDYVLLYRDHGGPDFGPERLRKLASPGVDLDSVILSIHGNLDEWELFMKSDDSASKDLLFLVVQILGEKVCGSDTMWEQEQLNVVMKTTVGKFFEAVKNKCDSISYGAVGTLSLSFQHLSLAS